MSPQTRNSTNANGKKPPKLDGKPSLSQIERHTALEKGKRVCIVCGKLSPISASIIYPKSRSRRKEFDNALKLPSYVSDALPGGCYICDKHFDPNEIELSVGVKPAQIGDSVVPTLNLDHDFLRELCALKEDELKAKSAVRMVKLKLGWDTKPPVLSEQENDYSSDQSHNSNDPDTLVSSLFGKSVLKQPNRVSSKRRSNSPPQLEASKKFIKLVPLSATKTQSQQPPVLEKMKLADDDSLDHPPALSPVLRKSQRTNPFKDLPVLEANNPTASASSTPSSKTPNELEKRDQLIQRLQQSLFERNTELTLLKKKLKITEELLQFYQEAHWKKSLDEVIDSLPLSTDVMSQRSAATEEQNLPAQATAMLVECNQSDLQHHLQKFLQGEQLD